MADGLIGTRQDERWKLVSSDSMVCGGGLVFTGTRVYVHLLWQFLAGGSTLDDFIEAYPTVDKEQAARVIELAGEFFEKEHLHHEGARL